MPIRAPEMPAIMLNSAEAGAGVLPLDATRSPRREGRESGLAERPARVGQQQLRRQQVSADSMKDVHEVAGGEPERSRHRHQADASKRQP